MVFFILHPSSFILPFMAIDCAKVHQDMLDAGLPVLTVYSADGTTAVASYSRALTAPEQAEAVAIIADPMNQVRVRRPLRDIHNDVSALSGAQLTAIWNDL